MMDKKAKAASPLLVSACLLGVNSRYDGTSAEDPALIALIGDLKATPVIPVCPEQLGGLSTPRAMAEIRGGDGRAVLDSEARVIDLDGADVTENFIKGAEEVLKIALLIGAKKALLKEKSPSCGVAFIKKHSALTNGMGVLTALLKREGIEVEGV